MTLSPIKIFSDSIGGKAYWQNKSFITPNKLRSKGYGDYIKKRDEKAQRKTLKRIRKEEARGEDDYLYDAFK